MQNTTHPDRHPAIEWREALVDVWWRDTIGSSARLVAFCLSMHVNYDGEVWPGAALLAAESGLAERTVRASLHDLERAGWLVLVERGGVRGGHRTSRWKVTTPAEVAGVTPATGAGMWITTPANDDLTPATGATTPATGATTPATDGATPATAAPELVELETEEVEELGAALACPKCGDPGRPIDEVWWDCPNGCHGRDAYYRDEARRLYAVGGWR